MAKTLLWINSSSYETESYRDALSDKGFSVENCRDCHDALGKLNRKYEVIVLNPYFLTIGLETVKEYPETRAIGASYLGPGLWLYGKIRESENSRTPLFLFPIGLSRIEEKLLIVTKVMKNDTAPVYFADAVDTLPSDLCKLVEKNLKSLESRL